MECKFCNQHSCNCHHFILRTSSEKGRLCNHLIRNMATSFIAEKIDLYVEYASQDRISRLGIPLYVGKKIYRDIIMLTEENYSQILENTPIVNINPNECYFQTSKISKMIYNRFRTEPIKTNIIEKNPYNSRYTKNNDCFVHIRLGDIAYYKINLHLSYYMKALNEVGDFDKLYIASDSPDHEIVQAIISAYPGKSEKVLLDEVETIQFGSTCQYVILSHGSFSAVIGWLSFNSVVYYPAYEETTIWYGDMFSVDPTWNKIADYNYE